MAKCLPLLCEVVFVLVVPYLYERLYWLREELYTPGYCIAPNPQWRFPVRESCVDKLVEILLCEGGDMELCARTSKHIRVFAIDPLSLTFSLLYCALH